MKQECSQADLAEQVKIAEALRLRAAKTSFMAFLRDWIIDCRPEPRPFLSVADPWQIEIAQVMAPRLEYVAGLSRTTSAPRNFLLVMPRGHDKTSMEARVALWLLMASKRKIAIGAAAADKEQIELLRESMLSECGLNAWSRDRVRFHQDYVRGLETGSYIKFHSSDAPSAYGQLCDFYIFDELTNWKNQELFDALYSGTKKRPGSGLVIITNAGVKKARDGKLTWQWDLYQLSLRRQGANWWYTKSVPPGELWASWLDKADFMELAQSMTPGEARRVLRNEWIDESEDTEWVSPGEAAACVNMEMTYQEAGVPGIQYVGAIDYGPKRDRTVLVIGHKDHERHIVIDRMDVWQGSPEAPVPIADVEAWIEYVHTAFNCPTIVCDTYQLEGTVQKYETLLPITRFEPRGGKSNYEMAETLRTYVVNSRIHWYPGCGSLLGPSGIECLHDEMGALVVKRMVYGYRFDHESGRHDDRTVAVGMMALELARDVYSCAWVPGTSVVKPATPLERVNPSTLYNKPVGLVNVRGLYGLKAQWRF
jgi:hypothetical protein